MLVPLTPIEVERCEEFARRVVESYKRGQKERSISLSVPGMPGIWDNPQVQAYGRRCEVGCCIWLGLDWRTALDWRADRCDDLVDFRHNGHTVDVKGSGHEDARYLIWSVGKIGHMDKMADRLILARTGNRNLKNKVEIVGWTSREHFLEHHRKAEPTMRLVEGTPFLHADDLEAPEDWSRA